MNHSGRMTENDERYYFDCHPAVRAATESIFPPASRVCATPDVHGAIRRINADMLEAVARDGAMTLDGAVRATLTIANLLSPRHGKQSP